jgi:hypothetical protein
MCHFYFSAFSERLTISPSTNFVDKKDGEADTKESGDDKKEDKKDKKSSGGDKKKEEKKKEKKPKIETLKEPLDFEVTLLDRANMTADQKKSARDKLEALAAHDREKKSRLIGLYIFL